MKKNFKKDHFEKNLLNAFVYDIQAAGLAVEPIWKRNNKIVAVEDEKVNRLDLKLNGKLIFRMMRTQGTYNDKSLSQSEKELMLKLMVRYNFYTKAEWETGIVLAFLYGAIIFMYPFFIITGWLGTLYLICGLITLGFLFIAYRHSMAKIEKRWFTAIQIIGVITYILTALASLLTIPLYKTITYNNLYQQIQPYLLKENSENTSQENKDLNP